MTPIRWLQLTTLAAAIYATAGIIDGLTASFNMSRQLQGAFQATLGVGFILSGGACLLQRYTDRIARQLAEAHDEREEFRRRFEDLARSVERGYEDGYAAGLARDPMRPQLHSVNGKDPAKAGHQS